jgi:serralysin
MPGSGNVLIDAIAGIGWLSRGGDRNITFFFDNSLGFHNWTSGEKDAFQAALQQYANVANITIQQVGSSAAADLSERWVSDACMPSIFGDFAGFHEFPKSSPPAGGAYNFDGRSYYTTSGLAAGGLGFEVFLHEIGHGLGLAHPHDTAMGTGLLPGVTSESSLGTLGYNQGLYTVTSYNDGPALSSGSNNYGHAATPMAFDIAAMQFLYGANNGYRTGADIYVIPDSNAAGASWQCIWDAGGTDEIAYYYGSRDVTIDLRAATIVNGDPNAGGFTSGATGIFGGFTIAKGAVIENVWGGNGNDAIWGNAANNRLVGNGGNDTFFFTAGTDTVDGGAGDDRVIYSGNLSGYTVRDLGTSISVLGSIGTNGLTSVEHLQFADGTINPDDGNPVFDTVLYDVRNPDVFRAGIGALDHYNSDGWREGRDPNSVFSTNFYLGANRDVVATGANPLDHYHRSGWKEGRDPSASFDTALYLKNNPDVAAAGIDPLEHYLLSGAAEAAQPTRRSGPSSTVSTRSITCRSTRISWPHASIRWNISTSMAGARAAIRTPCSTRPATSLTMRMCAAQGAIRCSTTSCSAGAKGEIRQRASTRAGTLPPIPTSRQPASTRSTTICSSAFSRDALSSTMASGASPT